MSRTDRRFLILEKKKTIYGTLEENITYMNAVLPIRESFDLVQRDIVIGERKSSFYLFVISLSLYYAYFQLRRILSLRFGRLNFRIK